MFTGAKNMKANYKLKLSRWMRDRNQLMDYNEDRSV